MGKYRVDTIRLKNWDYRSNGQYFITVRTKEEGNILGKIIDGKLTPNTIGMHADKCMDEIPEHFPHVKLHAKVVMPDHVHMLLEINKRNHVASRHGVTRQKEDDPVETCHGMSLLQINRPQKGSISIIINHFKGAVKRYCNQNGLKFAWQGEFYDRIIRNEIEFENTVIYILTNPQKYRPR